MQVGAVQHQRAAWNRHRQAVGGSYAQIGAGYAHIGAPGGGAQQLQGRLPGWNSDPTLSDGVSNSARQLPLGVPSATLAASTGSSIIPVTAQIIFTPVRLMLFESVTGATFVQQIVIGQRPQMASLNVPLPTQMFAFNATDSLVGFDTATTGQSLTLTVVNTNAGTPVFYGGVIAICAMPPG